MSSASPHEQQASMLRALLGQDPAGDFQALLRTSPAARLAQTNRGIRVYQANAAALAERTLASTFPVLAQLIGATSFEPLASYFWRKHPPVRGDMGEWGQPLAEFLDASPQLADEPFLGDVARIEWALHRAASAADATLDAASFSMLSEPPEHTQLPLSLGVSQGTFTLASAFPVVSIVNAHISGEPSIAKAAELIGSHCGEYALVWRQGFKPRVRTSSPAEFALVNSLLQRLPIETALGAAHAVDPAFDFNRWLGQAVRTGLIYCAYRLANDIAERPHNRPTESTNK